MHLGTVFVGQFGDSLDLDDDLAEANEIRDIPLKEFASLVDQREFGVRLVRDLLEFKFNLQALLIHGLRKPAPFLFVHLEASPHDAVAFIFEQQFHRFLPFVCFVCFVVHRYFCGTKNVTATGNSRACGFA